MAHTSHTKMTFGHTDTGAVARPSSHRNSTTPHPTYFPVPTQRDPLAATANLLGPSGPNPFAEEQLGLYADASDGEYDDYQEQLSEYNKYDDDVYETAPGRTSSAWSNKSTKRAAETSTRRGIRKDSTRATTERGKNRTIKLELRAKFDKPDEREPSVNPEPFDESEDWCDFDESLTCPVYESDCAYEDRVHKYECEEPWVPAAKSDSSTAKVQVPATKPDYENEDDDYGYDDYDDKYDSFYGDHASRSGSSRSGSSRSGSSRQSPYTAKHVRAVTGKMELHAERKDLFRATPQARTGARLNKLV